MWGWLGTEGDKGQALGGPGRGMVAPWCHVPVPTGGTGTILGMLDPPDHCGAQ